MAWWWSATEEGIGVKYNYNCRFVPPLSYIMINHVLGVPLPQWMSIIRAVTTNDLISDIPHLTPPYCHWGVIEGQTPQHPSQSLSWWFVVSIQERITSELSSENDLFVSEKGVVLSTFEDLWYYYIEICFQFQVLPLLFWAHKHLFCFNTSSSTSSTTSWGHLLAVLPAFPMVLSLASAVGCSMGAGGDGLGSTEVHCLRGVVIH